MKQNKKQKRNNKIIPQKKRKIKLNKNGKQGER